MDAGQVSAPVEGDRLATTSWGHVMGWTSRRLHAPVCVLVTVILLSCCLFSGSQAVVRPLLGTGEFPAAVDVINRWQGEQRLDVMVLVEVVNADIGYSEEKGGLVGRLRIEV
ncbi:hypothetical protein DRQ50_14140, partial [bacterium]